jgi:hypothetical protein
VIQDAADQTRLGDEGDHAHEASAAGTDERIDLVDPSDELGPSAAQGGQSWGRWRRLLRRRQGHSTHLRCIQRDKLEVQRRRTVRLDPLRRTRRPRIRSGSLARLAAERLAVRRSGGRR